MQHVEGQKIFKKAARPIEGHFVEDFYYRVEF
jgi:hypothetical protein